MKKSEYSKNAIKFFELVLEAMKKDETVIISPDFMNQAKSTMITISLEGKDHRHVLSFEESDLLEKLNEALGEMLKEENK